MKHKLAVMPHDLKTVRIKGQRGGLAKYNGVIATPTHCLCKCASARSFITSYKNLLWLTDEEWERVE